MQIPFHRPYITENEINSVVDSLKNYWITMGKKTIEFEEKFKNYIGTQNATAVNSCTAALHLALKAIGLKEGDEVITSATTFISNSEVVRYFNAKTVLVDIERDTHNIDINKIEEKITGKTKAIIPVHFAGQPADMDEIIEIARMHNLYVIEDAAHSLPARFKSKLIGTIGDITCFSFYATKTLTTGEGGMITTGNDEWAKKMSIWRQHGMSKDAWDRYTDEGDWEYDVIDAGYKYNTTDINAAMGIEQLKILDWMQKERERIAERYNSAFNTEEGIVPYVVKEDRTTAWHLYPLRLDMEALTINRNQFINEMNARGIGTSVHFKPIYRFTYYKNLGYQSAHYPESEWVYERSLSIPIFPGMSDEEIDYVIGNTLDIIRKNKR